MKLRVEGVSKFELIAKLLIYSAIYGLFQVNYIDLIVPGTRYAGYHLWLTTLYFAPFIPLLFVGVDWKLVLSMGLLVSLINDLLYYPSAILLFDRKVDLWRFYLRQLGLMGWQSPEWNLNFLFFSVKPYSWLMGLTVYIRITIATICLKHL